MSAKVIQEGFATAGFNQKGELVQQDLAMVHAEVPGSNGEWCFIIQDTNFCWVKGLKSGKGYKLYKRCQLTGDPEND